MKSWENRPIEIANLLNPAFCGEVLRLAVGEYVKARQAAFPYSLAFLVLPIVLHRATRESIRKGERRQLHVWMQDNQEVRIRFAERASDLVPVTRESIAFLLQVNALNMDAQAGLRVVAQRRSRASTEPRGEVADCYQKAINVGRWFARAGSPTTIYTIWGVKP